MSDIEMGALIMLAIEMAILLAANRKRASPKMKIITPFKNIVECFEDLHERYFPDWHLPMDDLNIRGTEENLWLLNPEKDAKSVKKEYVKKKFACGIGIFYGVSILLTVGSFLSSEGNLLSGNIIQRNDPGQGSKNVNITYQHNGEENEYSLRVLSKQYSDEELLELIDSKEEEFQREILMENESFDHISSSLNLMDTWLDGNLQVNWEISDYRILTSAGEINEREVEKKEGEYQSVELKACLSRQELQVERNYSLKIYSPDYTEDQLFLKALEKEIESLNEETKYQKDFQLPDNINGENIVWSENSGISLMAIIILSIIAALGIFLAQDIKLKNELKERNRQLELDYPEFVNKLILMLSAGNSLENSWDKIVRTYQEKKKDTGSVRFVYEEMQVTQNDFSKGLGSISCLERFGNRIGLACYKRCMLIIIHSIKKGPVGLKEKLLFEVEQSYEERKKLAKIMGEEASTKMLLPMGMMLIVVLVVVVAPSIMSVLV